MTRPQDEAQNQPQKQPRNELKNDGNGDSRSGIESARRRNQARLVLVGMLILASIGLGAATRLGPDAKASRAPAPGLSAPGVPNHSAVGTAAGGIGPVYLSAQLDRGAVLQGGDGLLNLELSIRAEADANPSPNMDVRRTAIDLVVVLDRSGSMSGTALEHAVASVSELIASLGPEDRFALVSYASDARLDVTLAKASPQARQSWSRSLRLLRAQGGTNMALGLDFANAEVTRAREAGRAVRVILLSDGHANQGDHSHEGLRARASAAVSGEYVLSAVGVGGGFDEQLMATLADAGTGNFYYVSELAQLSGVFAGEFASARETVAEALVVSIEPGPGVVLLDAAGYPLERAADGRVRFRPGALFAGQERRIWLSFRADSQKLGEQTLGRVSLRYFADGEQREVELGSSPQFACVEGEKAFHASVDKAAWGRSIAREGLSKLKQAMSLSLQKGDVASARTALDRYRVDAERQNVRYQNELVEQALEDADEMKLELEEAVSQSPAVRNAYRKKLSQEGYDGRRSGAKHR